MDCLLTFNKFALQDSHQTIKDVELKTVDHHFVAHFRFVRQRTQIKQPREKERDRQNA